MPYYFKHKDHTGDGEPDFIGVTAEEAYITLAEEYDLDLDDIFNLVYEGYVWEERPYEKRDKTNA
jgi:hypothetical protein